MIAWICVAFAFAGGFVAGCALMVWIVKQLAHVEAAIEEGAKAASV